MKKLSITDVVISNDMIRQRIAEIFPDSVVVDNNFNFVSVSQNVLDAIGYSSTELKETSIQRIIPFPNVAEYMRNLLSEGYFAEQRFLVQTRTGSKISFGVSGFYLGLVADVSGLIVLKFTNYDDISLMHNKLQAKTAEIDEFVYLSSHALRGPLATIKGLTNLARFATDKSELDFLINQIDSFADKLDDKLHRLIYFAESDKGHESPELEKKCIGEICNNMRDLMAESSIDHPIKFDYTIQDGTVAVHQPQLVEALLRNILLFLCERNKSADSHIALDAHSSQSAIEIIFRATGFNLDDDFVENLRHLNDGYSEILSHPELLNCYAAKKVLFRLQGKIHFITASKQELIVLITLPQAF